MDKLVVPVADLFFQKTEDQRPLSRAAMDKLEVPVADVGVDVESKSAVISN